LADPRVKAIGFVGSSAIAEYIYATGCARGKRMPCFGGAKNHMIVMPDADIDQAVDALIGAGYGSAGERCIAVSVAVPVGKQTAKELVKRLIGPYRPCSTLSLKNPPLGIAIAAGFDQSCDLDSFDTLGPFS